MHACTLHPDDTEEDMARAIDTFRRRLQETWHTDQDLTVLADALAALFGDADAAVCEFDREGHCVRSADTFRTDRDGGAQLAPVLRALPPGDPVLGHELDERLRRWLRAACDLLPGPDRAAHVLATTLHDDGAPLVGLCVLRPRPFGRRDVATFTAAAGAAHELRVARRALDERPLGASALSALLETHPAPAFLVAGDAVLYANPEARRRGWTRPPATAAFREAPLGPLVLLLAEPGAREPPWSGLAPWLARVAALAADGLSDKEIAAELDMSHATVRTAVCRVLRHYGLNSRRQLMHRRR
jgi:DNA-binding CsgD family transcriptional regulator